jgi:hypothetical protein
LVNWSRKVSSAAGPFLLAAACIFGHANSSANTCGDDSVSKKVESTFKVIRISKTKVECSFDRKMNVITHRKEAAIDSCSVELQDLKSGEKHSAMGGSAACKYKIGQQIKKTVQYSCCGSIYAVQCALGKTNKIFGTKYKDDFTWFCSANDVAYIVGSLKNGANK